ncbi:MAG: sulfatase-like hydrolase/transferase, partial [Elusimicrobiaceae bacterium]
MRFPGKAELLYCLGLALPVLAPFLASWFCPHVSAAQVFQMSYAGVFSIFVLAPFLLIGLRTAAVISAVIFGLLGYLILFYINLYGVNISGTTVFVLFETNMAETNEYLDGYLELTFPFVLFLVSVAASLCAALWSAGRVDKKVLKKIGGICTGAAVLSLLIPAGWRTFNERNVFFMIGKQYARYMESIRDYRAAAGVFPGPAVADRHKGAETYVLVLSESINKSRLGLYGYRRDTTPELGAIGKELYSFNNASTTHAHTIPAVMDMISFPDGKTGKPVLWTQYLKKAGFKTFWLSNQQPVGITENLVAVIGESFDYKVFINTVTSVNTSDTELFPYLNDALNAPDEKKIIVLHLMAAHTAYAQRYPPDYDRFKDDCGRLNPKQCRIYNEYDNALLFSDYIARRIIEDVRGRGGRSAVLYFSDHGEDVYDSGDFYGHAEAMGTKYMMEVP